jgi:hypothetical protein
MTARLIEKAHLSAKGLIDRAKRIFQKVKEPLKERLDEVNPRELRPAFTSIFSALQRGKQLEKFVFLNGKYLLLNDGTGFFSSKKNDCERNAAVRLLRDFRREHPHLPVIVVEDALSANGPHLKLLLELKMSFITVVKPDGNKALFDWVNGFEWGEDRSKWDGSQGLRFINRVSLNDTHTELKVNFLEYWEISPNGEVLYHNTWITDMLISQENAYIIARGGRARWHIENETFNTLKNQGYHFEHNFGHGYKHLSTVFAILMMLAFLIDQAEQLSCGLFQAALTKLESKKSRLWREIRGFFNLYIVPSWKVLYQTIINGDSRKVPILNTS